LILAGSRLLDLFSRRWAARRLGCVYVFHTDGRRLADFRTSWESAAAAVGHPRLLFHDLRRSGARNLRRAGLQEGTIMKLGGWKTRAMFLRYDITDESDLAAAAVSYDRFLDTTGPRKVIPLPTGTD
jgi:integrase